MGKRVESPSSINTFLQCPRKYYYQYIEKLPTKPSIHLVRGTIAHAALEAFYLQDTSSFSKENYPHTFKKNIQNIFCEEWSKHKKEIANLNLSQREQEFYFEETLLMLLNWCDHFLNDFSERLKATDSVQEAFTIMRPVTETEYSSESYSVHGFIDAIQHIDGEVQIIDYKTNASFEIKDSIKLQLGIYSLLYEETHGTPPDKIGVFFLRDKLHLQPVDKTLLATAKQAIETVHEHTSRTEKIKDYQKKTSPLCKWKSGQCDFYGVCKPF